MQAVDSNAALLSTSSTRPTREVKCSFIKLGGPPPTPPRDQSRWLSSLDCCLSHDRCRTLIQRSIRNQEINVHKGDYCELGVVSPNERPFEASFAFGVRWQRRISSACDNQGVIITVVASRRRARRRWRCSIMHWREPQYSPWLCSFTG